MAEGTLEVAQKRLASSRRGLLRIASTPRLPEVGINALFLQSDQRRYHLLCPGCGLEQPLQWEANVDRARPAVVCRRCGEQMDRLAPGRWIPEAPGNTSIHGYHLNRLYSPWLDLPAMIAASEATTPAGVQEFQNSDLAEPFVPPGGGLSIDVLDRCRRDYKLDDYGGQPCDMGVDVGIVLHVVIRERLPDEKVRPNAPARLWFAGEVAAFSDLRPLMDRFRVERCVIDALPETHSAHDLAQADARVALAHYDRRDPGHEPDWGRPNRLHINRLEAIDAVMHRFHDEVALLPQEARRLDGRMRDGIGEYYRELLAPTRTLEQDAAGNWVARWLDRGRPDHFTHAEVYCLLARVTRRPRLEFT